MSIRPPAPGSEPGTPMLIRAELVARGPAAAVILTDEQVEAIGRGRKTAPVRVTVHGRVFSGRIGRMGGENLLGFSKAARATCGVEIGQQIEVEIALDEAPREVEIPAELQAALERTPGARSAFDRLSYTNRKELARRVAEAKRPETRERRVRQVLASLQTGS